MTRAWNAGRQPEHGTPQRKTERPGLGAWGLEPGRWTPVDAGCWTLDAGLWWALGCWLRARVAMEDAPSESSASPLSSQVAAPSIQACSTEEWCIRAGGHWTMDGLQDLTPGQVGRGHGQTTGRQVGCSRTADSFQVVNQAVLCSL